MSKQNKTYETETQAYRLDISWDGQPPGWFGMLTWYLGDEAIISISAKASSVTEVNRVVWEAMFRSAADFQDGKLVLPSMGDYDVKYWYKGE